MVAKLKTHPYADLFPLMTAVELDALAADIKANGLLQPVVLYQGAVLDGRNRLLACERAGVEPTFTEHEGDDASALALVISLNVQRRDLTAAQRAIVAARAWGVNDSHKRGRPEKGEKVQTVPFSLDALSKQFKSSKSTIIQARDLLADAPDLAAQVEACTISLAAAYGELQARRAQAKQKSKDAERIAEYADAISGGEITLEEALQKAVDQEREEKEKQAAEADARRQWLKGFAESLGWFERFVHDEWSDEDFGWYVQPETPGLFEHGITVDRVVTVIAKLQRTKALFSGEKNANPPKGRSQARPRSV